MVRNNPQGSVHIVGVRQAVAVSNARIVRCELDNILKKIAVEIGAFILADSRNAFQAHAGVDARVGEGFTGSVRFLVILHENQVPNFQKTVAIAFSDAAVVTASHVFALVNENFRTGTAGTGVAHAPKIIFSGYSENSVSINAYFVPP